MINETTKKGIMLLGAAVLAVGITACSIHNDKEGAQAPSVSPSASPSASAEADRTTQGGGERTGDGHAGGGAGAKESTGGGAGSGNAVSPDLPASKELAVSLEGGEEKRTAHLAKGEGFALYVFDIFAFDAKQGLLSMKADPNCYARIEKLPEGYKLEDIKKAANEQLAKVGEVYEMPLSEIHPSLGGADLMLIGSNNMLTQEVIVKKVDGTGYRIHVNMPSVEASEGFGPHLFASLSTLVNL